MDLHTLVQRLAFEFYNWDGYTNGEARVSPQPFLLSEKQCEELTAIALAFDRLIRRTVALYHAERRVRRFFQLPLSQRRMMGIMEHGCLRWTARVPWPCDASRG